MVDPELYTGYCDEDDVKAIIDTALQPEEISVMIEESDQEIIDRKLTGRSTVTLRYISKYLTAEQIAMKNPIPEKSIGDSTGSHAPEYYRAMAERRIMQHVPDEVMPAATFPWE
jgi:hypothetical protein